MKKWLWTVFHLNIAVLLVLAGFLSYQHIFVFVGTGVDFFKEYANYYYAIIPMILIHYYVSHKLFK